jgi:DNA-cytosine methyltransferase
MINTLDLFTGIGGFVLGSKITGGFNISAMCEINPHCQVRLAKRFPGVPLHDDIRTLDSTTLSSLGVGRIDCIWGGFPCQDLSQSNPNGKGLAGERSGLFFEVMRIVRDIQPRYVLLENVRNLLSKNQGKDFGIVLSSLEQAGYHVEWDVISARDVGAKHLRERIFILAYPTSFGRYYWSHHWERGQIPSHINGDDSEASEEWEGLFSDFGQMGQVLSYPLGKRLEMFESIDRNTNEEFSTFERVCVGSGANTVSRRSESRVGRNPNGLPSGLDGYWSGDWERGIPRVADKKLVADHKHRIEMLGNAVLPQVAAVAQRRILELEEWSICNNYDWNLS